MNIKFKPQDFWIGLFWKTEKHPRRNRVCGVDCQPGDGHCNNYCNHDHSKPMAAEPPAHDGTVATTWYLCLLPCFPISWTTRHVPRA